MKKTFQKWLLLFFFISFCLTSATSYVLTTKHTEESAIQNIRLKIAYLQQQIDIHNASRDVLKLKLKEYLGRKTKDFAFTLTINPSLAKEIDFLETWRKENNFSTLQLIDSNGDTTFVLPMKNEDVAKTSFVFEQMKDQPSSSIEEPCPNNNGWNDDFKLTTYVSFKNGDYLKTSLSCERYAEIMGTLSIKKLASNLKIDKRGFILIAQGNDLISNGNEDFSINDFIKTGIMGEIYKKDPENLYSPKNTGIFRSTLGGENAFFYYMPSKNYMLIGVYPEKSLHQGRTSMLFFNILLHFSLLFVIYILITILLNRIVISGIKKTNTSLQKITRGDLNEKVDVHTNEEFISLSEGINTTVEALKKANSIAAKRISDELKLAREIQISSLPRTFPPFPDKNSFDIFALTRPAKEVSGDFYDFFLLGPEHSQLAVIIADAAGKGIPAALFVMTTRALLKNQAELGYSPAEIFTRINHQLCENNETSMFVTAFMGILNIETGLFTYVNAGHNPPYFCRKGKSFEAMNLKPGFTLGAINNIVYEQNEIIMENGDTLFMYTDGVTESQNKNNELFTEERLQKTLNENTGKTVNNLLSNIDASVKQFEDGNEQSDDFTMIGLQYLTGHISLSANIDEIDNLLDFIENMTVSYRSKFNADIAVAAEEIFVNIAKYAYPDKNDGKVNISCAIGGSPTFISIRFTDSGIPFNPLNKPDPDINVPLIKRKPGNMGIYMVKRMMDSVVYTYKDNQNILTIQKIL